jgi:hypothetical protein
LSWAVLLLLLSCLPDVLKQIWLPDVTKAFKCPDGFLPTGYLAGNQHSKVCESLKWWL